VPYALIVLIISLTVVVAAAVLLLFALPWRATNRSGGAHTEYSLVHLRPPIPIPIRMEKSIHSISTSQQREKAPPPKLRLKKSRLGWNRIEPGYIYLGWASCLPSSRKQKSSKKTNLINACAIFLLL